MTSGETYSNIVCDGRIRDWLVSISLSGLMLLRAGDRILSLPVKYLRFGHAWQFIAGVVCLTVFLWTLRQVGRQRSPFGWLARAMFLFLPLAWLPDALASIQGVATAYIGFITFLGKLRFGVFAARALPLAIVLGTLIGLAYLVTEKRGRKWVQTYLAFTSVLPLLIIFQILFRLWTPSHGTTQATPLLPPARRVVWLVFDELDQLVLSENTQTLPGFKALSEGAFMATQARAPGNSTDLSLPNLWTGESVYDAHSSPAGMLIRSTPDGPWSRDWINGRTVFERIHDLGLGVRIVGWHLPYYALFPDRPGMETDDSSPFMTPGPYQGIFAWMLRENLIWNQLYVLNAKRYENDPERLEAYVEHIPKVHLYRSFQQLVEEQEILLAAAIHTHTDALVFGHIAAPHLPISTQTHFPLPGTPEQNYLANLGRCDQFLAKSILPFVQAPAIPTMVIVTSDHWFRYADVKSQNGRGNSSAPGRPIPFIVYLSGETRVPKPYGREFNTERTRELVEAYLGGRISSYRDLKDMLDKWPASKTRIKPR